MTLVDPDQYKMEIKNSELASFMEQMRISMETLGNEIKTSNEGLGKEICGCKQELKLEMKMMRKKFNEDIDEVRADGKQLKEDLTKMHDTITRSSEILLRIALTKLKMTKLRIPRGNERKLKT